MENSKKSAVQNIGSNLLNSLGQDDESKNVHLKLNELSDIYDEEKINLESLQDFLIKIKLGLYIQARHLQSAFFEEAILEAKKRNTFFKFTVNVNFRKDLFDFDNLKSSSPEKAGTLESIYWYKRNGRKIDGNVKYFIERIPLNDPEGISYKRRAFVGAVKWQTDLIMKYEERFSKIRKACRLIGEFKRKLKLLNSNIDDLSTILKEMENHDLNSTITKEETDSEPNENLKEE